MKIGETEKVKTSIPDTNPYKSHNRRKISLGECVLLGSCDLQPIKKCDIYNLYSYHSNDIIPIYQQVDLFNSLFIH